MIISGIVSSNIKKLITAISDLFNRTTSGSLGNADTGQTWGATSGVWYANGSAAQSDTAATSYPLASIALTANTTVSAGVTEGTGVAFWVTDANNWYATVAYHTQTSYSCGCGTCCNTCSHTGGSCGQTTTCNTCTHAGGSCGSIAGCPNGAYPYICGGVCTSGVGCSGSSIPASFTPITCTNSDCTACGSTVTDNTCTNSDCTACGSYSCGCSTCYNDYYWMRMLKAVAGTVSTVISDYSVASLPVGIKVITSGGTITEYAYSDAALGTLIGSTSTTPTSPIIGTRVGIIKTPAAVSQGSTVDNFHGA